MSRWGIRVAGLFAIASMVWCGPWLIMHLNVNELWLSVPFTVAFALTMALTLVTVINEWNGGNSAHEPAPVGDKLEIGVLIPTYGEPFWMVGNTVKSVLAQTWPGNQLVIVVSDDGNSSTVKREVDLLQRSNPDTRIVYHVPPGKGSEQRRGDAKAGNLNSAYERLISEAPDVTFVETRDADDLAADRDFLRTAAAALHNHPDLAYVQTIKTAETSPGDPFNNLEPFFYLRMMPSRDLANAVFPCGSGLLWRRKALEDIGLFPTWSLVEDLMSGIEALKRGWKSSYIEIEGAHAQHAPEDIPNVYKQRGTWALDTMRIMFWMDLSGLNIRQRLQFAQMAIFYLHSLATLIFTTCLTVTLFTGTYPFQLDGTQAAIRFWPLIIAIEVFLITLHAGMPLERVWRLREMATGLSPVYASACLRALFGGPDHRYTYKVTRKDDQFQWYWKETLPQLVMFLALSAGIVYHITNISSWSTIDAGLVYLSLLQVLPLAGFLRKSWFGIDPLLNLRIRVRRQLEGQSIPARSGD